jgi:uncharacterized membrane protein
MTEILLLRLVHILAGACWLGSGVFSAFFLMPAITSSGVDSGKLFGELQRRGLFTFMPLIGVLTILSGLRLLWILSDRLGPAYFATAAGRAFTVSGAAAIVTFILALFVSRPASVRAGRLAGALAGAPEAQRAGLAREIATLRRRASVTTWIAVGLLLLATAGMSVARYL